MIYKNLSNRSVMLEIEVLNKYMLTAPADSMASPATRIHENWPSDRGGAKLIFSFPIAHFVNIMFTSSS